jgi:hypothetical protein
MRLLPNPLTLPQNLTNGSIIGHGKDYWGYGLEIGIFIFIVALTMSLASGLRHGDDSNAANIFFFGTIIAIIAIPTWGVVAAFTGAMFVYCLAAGALIGFVGVLGIVSELFPKLGNRARRKQEA